MDKFLSRKFGIAAFMLIALVSLLVFGYVSQEVFQFMGLGIVGMYFTGDVTQDYLMRDKAK